ncbi:hypothetical protein BGX28_008792 [Mortierella sp. GBA30]|nr:hypothetical protein BGX28_008792 [Mortierella sp. GBA30]
MSNPPGQAGPWTKDLRNDVHAWIGYKGKPYPCGGYKKGPVTTYNAGQVIPVRFWTFGMDWRQKFPRAGLKTSRHGGGACEFSLSYDSGKTWSVIGQYTKTCPDVYYEWPVKIPDNVPACADSNKCLFAFSWTAYATNQFYQHCANIVIRNTKNGPKYLPPLKRTVVDVKALGQKMNTHANGDARGGKSSGPNPVERKQNLGNYYAGTSRNGKGRSVNLGLVRS